MNFKRIVVSLVMLVISQSNYGQKLEYGGMLNIERTTLSIPNGATTIYSNGSYSEGADRTGFETNFGIGFYGSYTIKDNVLSVGCELFYDKTSSTEINVSFQAINIVPYVDVVAFSNFHFSLGVGTGVILNSPTFENSSYESKSNDFVAKASIGYRVKNYCTIEMGMYPPVTSVVEGYLNRDKYYFGIKVPLDKYL